jgi:hypothetical protein
MVVASRIDSARERTLRRRVNEEELVGVARRHCRTRVDRFAYDSWHCRTKARSHCRQPAGNAGSFDGIGTKDLDEHDAIRSLRREDERVLVGGSGHAPLGNDGVLGEVGSALRRRLCAGEGRVGLAHERHSPRDRASDMDGSVLVVLPSGILELLGC